MLFSNLAKKRGIDDNTVQRARQKSIFGLLGNGDFLIFLPVAILAGITILCYATIVPGLFKRNDKAMGAMALATAIVLFLAASGIAGGGTH